MSEREFWIMIRSALCMVISAIEKRYKLGAYAEGKIQEVGATDSLT